MSFDRRFVGVRRGMVAGLPTPAAVGLLYAACLAAADIAPAPAAERPESTIKRMVIPGPADAAQGPAGSEAIGGQLDIVVRDSGAAQLGNVDSLTGDTLRLRDTSGAVLAVPRRELQLVNFTIGQTGRTARPPEASGQGADLVVTYDGRSLLTEVRSITADAVVTSGQTLRRASVDLVVFGRAGPSGTGPSEPPVDALCPADKPLGGWMRWRISFDNGACRTDEEASARFRLTEVVSRFAGTPTLFKANSLHLDAFGSECVDTHPYADCSGPGVEWSGPVEGNAWYWPLIPGLTIGWQTPVVVRPYKCEFAGESVDYEWDFPAPAARHVSPREHASICRRGLEEGAVLGVPPPGPCYDDLCRFEMTQACTENPERFFVLPFAGETSGDWLEIYKPHHMAWNVCCGCGEAAATEVGEEQDEEEDCFAAAKALAQYWYVEMQQRFAALLEGIGSTPYDLPVADTAANREEFTRFFASWDSFMAGMRQRRDALLTHHRSCIDCAQEQGLDPGQCLHPDELDWRDHPDL